jgi:hypothetical protein
MPKPDQIAPGDPDLVDGYEATLRAYGSSIAVDGISLTVARVKPYIFEVAIIPHTFDNTNLLRAKAGDPVNLEFDLLAKHALRQTTASKRRSRLARLLLSQDHERCEPGAWHSVHAAVSESFHA